MDIGNEHLETSTDRKRGYQLISTSHMIWPISLADISNYRICIYCICNDKFDNLYKSHTVLHTVMRHTAQFHAEMIELVYDHDQSMLIGLHRYNDNTESDFQ